MRASRHGQTFFGITYQLGVSGQTYYVWRKEPSQRGLAEIRFLRLFEEANRKRKKKLADLTRDT